MSQWTQKKYFKNGANSQLCQMLFRSQIRQLQWTIGSGKMQIIIDFDKSQFSRVVDTKNLLGWFERRMEGEVKVLFTVLRDITMTESKERVGEWKI